MSSTLQSVSQLCEAARLAGRTLAQLDTTTKNMALEGIAQALLDRADEVLEANALDLAAGRAAALNDSLLDRLTVTEDRLGSMASGVRAIASMPDPVGEVVERFRRPNGLQIRKLRVPLGVIAVVYEARPNVTIDAAALCLKSGNAIVLRGSSTAAHSNAVLAAIAADGAQAAGVPPGAIVSLGGGERSELEQLATQNDLIDLIIPRGGEGLKAALSAVATVPVIYAASGNCHVYVERSADLDEAEAIVLNAKTQRPGVCNAAETLLVDAAVAEAFVPRVVGALRAAGVEVRGDERVCELAPGAVPAGDADWDTEFLSLTIAAGVVNGVDQAIEHINSHGSGHSEAIVTRDTCAARNFELGVDAACVYVNASTRFTDGGEFGMGAEIGNSTQKLHARGPIGMRELCAFKYIIEGDGHVRT